MRFRARQRLGKYRIEKLLGVGGFADVYQALDTIEGVRVALKIPQPQTVTSAVLDDFRREVRLTARLDHPSLQAVKDASFIDGHFVVAVRLADRTLADRLRSPISVRAAVSYSEQLLAGLAHAHARGILHCDIKPENILLFGPDRVRLADFGLAKVALWTIHASGSGTVGYMAPEQAMGRPSPRSDVFSLALVMYRMFSGKLPQWPFEWPLEGYARLRQRVPASVIELLERCLSTDTQRRPADGVVLENSFLRLKAPILRHEKGRRSPRKKKSARTNSDWREARFRQFRREYGGALDTRFECRKCHGPVAENMSTCPWCGASRAIFREETTARQRCPRCRRGLRSDWSFCPFCYGAAVGPKSDREFDDSKYVQKACANPRCRRRSLLPFMRYCPWCRRKVRRSWRIAGARATCPRCSWGTLPEYWEHCPWCAARIKGTEARR